MMASPSIRYDQPQRRPLRHARPLLPLFPRGRTYINPLRRLRPSASFSPSIYNIYSNEDQIQTEGAETFHGIPLNNYNRKDLYVVAERTIPQGFGENIEIKTDVGMLDAHSVLHNTTMGTLIGKLLNGREPNWPAIIDDSDKG